MYLLWTCSNFACCCVVPLVEQHSEPVPPEWISHPTPHHQQPATQPLWTDCGVGGCDITSPLISLALSFCMLSDHLPYLPFLPPHLLQDVGHLPTGGRVSRNCLLKSSQVWQGGSSGWKYSGRRKIYFEVRLCNLRWSLAGMGFQKESERRREIMYSAYAILVSWLERGW